MLARAPKLRVVANCAVGFDNVDVAALTARAASRSTNTPDVLTEATAELAFALMLAAARRLPEGERLVRSGPWEGWRLDQLLGVQLLRQDARHHRHGPDRPGDGAARRRASG